MARNKINRDRSGHRRQRSHAPGGGESGSKLQVRATDEDCSTLNHPVRPTGAGLSFQGRETEQRPRLKAVVNDNQVSDIDRFEPFGYGGNTAVVAATTAHLPIVNNDLQDINYPVAERHSSSAGLQKNLSMGADEVPALTAAQFSAHAVTYRMTCARAAQLHDLMGSRGWVPRNFGTQASALAMASQARLHIPRPGLARRSRKLSERTDF
ncbi:hypothetical protein MFM001_39530 [Mycobacterium sp. MFM001]|uniref:PE family protein n=1 Tax=Mycobacterium sp. MFM001 TaxID=2049453 RepID=UPI000DA53457|nr:PE family protein [Mycobacterium sp. MFM001]GBE67491.1 hypothetical protein MFM001_39530 [Mycobacterium sp. MFM001]